MVQPVFDLKLEVGSDLPRSLRRACGSPADGSFVRDAAAQSEPLGVEKNKKLGF